jgi:hypothetical protein
MILAAGRRGAGFDITTCCLGGCCFGTTRTVFGLWDGPGVLLGDAVCAFSVETMASAQMNETRIGFIAVFDMFSPIFVRQFLRVEPEFRILKAKQADEKSSCLS